MARRPLRSGLGDTAVVGVVAGVTSWAPPCLRAPSTWSWSSFCLNNDWARTSSSRCSGGAASICFCSSRDLALYLPARGQDVVDRLRPAVGDVGVGIGVGDLGRPRRIGAGGDHPDEVGLADRGGR